MHLQLVWQGLVQLSSMTQFQPNMMLKHTYIWQFMHLVLLQTPQTGVSHDDVKRIWKWKLFTTVYIKRKGNPRVQAGVFGLWATGFSSSAVPFPEDVRLIRVPPLLPQQRPKQNRTDWGGGLGQASVRYGTVRGCVRMRARASIAFSSHTCSSSGRPPPAFIKLLGKVGNN